MSLFSRIKVFFSPRHTVQKGDTLSAIAAHYYGDATKWHKIVCGFRHYTDSRKL